jgi:antitoxin ParD1/3/4
MSGYVLTPRAKADICNIWAYIADHNQDAADREEQAIFDACAFLAEVPLRGRSRPDLTGRPLRFWTLSRYPNYIIAVSAREGPASDRRCYARKERYPAHSQTAPVMPFKYKS